MSSRKIRIAFVIVLALSLVATSIAVAAGRDHGKKGNGQFVAHLIGYNEVPSLNSPAHGDLTLAVGDGKLTWSLTYAGFVNQPLVAHVHVGQPGVAGGVSFFFCGGAKPACPSSASGPVTITGTVLPADILGPTAQGFAAGDLNSIVKAIKAGFTYANMHTSAFTGGEIRGQLEAGHGHGHDDQGDND
jgi:CHRD domain-containing protein